MATQVHEPVSNAELYEQDYHLWALLTAEVLRESHVPGISMKDVAEEMVALARKDRHEVGSRLRVLIMHLLKWQAQPEYRAVAGENSWKRTIMEQRLQLADLFDVSPSLGNVASAGLQQSYAEAVGLASAETGLPEDAFPSKCAWSLETILDRGFYPSGPSSDKTD